MSDPQGVPVGDVVIHVESSGPPGAPPVLVLHGFTGDVSSMSSVIAALDDAYRVHGVDLIGHGGSSAPSSIEHYTMAACVRQLIAVMDALGVARAHLLGYSMGGRAALSLCAEAPERILSAVLVGASPGLDDPEEAARRRASDEALAQRIEREGLSAFVDHWMAIPLFASQKRLGEAALARARQQRLRCDPQGLTGSLRGMGTGSMPPLHARLSSIRVPLCLVAGAEDAKFRALAAQMAERLPEAECAVIDEAGHAAHLESPEAFAAVARRFFGRVEERSR